ncbi:MAG: alpha-glucosidase [Phaeodactylibacter sp.]|nr:alpha-glucosidase [Phaeodactylibacter sp.]
MRGLFRAVFLFFLLPVAAGGQAPEIRISPGAATIEYQGRTMLRLSLETPFLAAGRADAQVRYNRGSFHFKDKVRERCRDLELEPPTQNGDTSLLAGQLCGEPFTIKAYAEGAGQLNLYIRIKGEKHNRLYLTLPCATEEQFFGLGAQFSHVNLKGHRFPLWVGEQGIGRGDQPITALVNLYGAGGDNYTTSAPLPFLLSTGGYSVEAGGTNRIIADFRKKDQIGLEVWDKEATLSFQWADTPLQLVQAYTARTGRLPSLPDWAFGTIAGLQGGRDTVEKHIETMQAAGCPVDAIWIQDWVGQRQTFFGSQLRWYWEADQQHYPGFREFCREMNGKGIAVLGYINPFLTDAGPLFEKAREAGYFVKNQQGEDYAIQATGFTCYLFDLTNPGAYAWLKKLITANLIDMGLDGWMADFGEWLPWDAVLHSGQPASEYHNRYPVDWARLNREAIEEAGKLGEVAFFARAAYTGSNRYATFYWQGDQLVNWGKHDGLPSVVPGLLSSGMGGMSVNHADVGGFTSIKQFPVKIKRSRELLKRWIELCAFSPVFRTHESVRPRLNLQVYDDADILAFYTRFAQLRKQLRPYIQELMAEASEKGYPLARHLYLHYPKDRNTYGLQYQYLLGRDILVLPVLKKGRKKVKGYFPEGEWTHWQDGHAVKGSRWKKVPAPLGQPAVYIRKGSGAEEIFGRAVSKEP